MSKRGYTETDFKHFFSELLGDYYGEGLSIFLVLGRGLSRDVCNALWKAADFGEVGIEPVIAELEALVTLLEGVPSRLRRRIINPNTGSNTAEKTFRRIYEEILEIPEPTD